MTLEKNLSKAGLTGIKKVCTRLSRRRIGREAMLFAESTQNEGDRVE
jgi:hypothetical protein